MALTNYYVDPAINANSGTGTSGDPFGDLQYALNTITRDATNGDQINIKAGTAEVLAAVLSLTTYGTPSATAPLVLRGYTSTANDGGQGEIDANGGAAIPSSVIYLIDLNIHNGGSATLITLAGGGVQNCRIANTSGTGIVTHVGTVFNCEITDCGTGVNASSATVVFGNYFKAGGVRNFTYAVNASGSFAATIMRNIFSTGSSGNGVYMSSARHRIIGNSIFGAASTGSGITVSNQANYAGAVILNNLIEGYSGSGGLGINFGNTTNHLSRYAGNGAFNNATNYANVGNASAVEDLDNEVLSASPFAKTGSDTFANRFGYFAPVDTGNVLGGAIQ